MEIFRKLNPAEGQAEAVTIEETDMPEDVFVEE